LLYVHNSFRSDSLPAGSSKTYIVPAHRKGLFSCVATVMLLAAAAYSQSVSLSSPGSGASVSSPVHVSASAGGGSYPVSAMWIYVDNQPVYKTTSASVNTYLSLSAGSHHIVPVAWNSIGQSFTKSIYVTVTSGTAGVTVASPLAGSSVASPVNFSASAKAPSGRTISAMRIYVDSATALTTSAASINTSISMSKGTHGISIQAWDNTGAVYVKNLSVSVGSTTTPTTTSSQYLNNFNAASKWISQFSAPSGALLYAPTQIDPYFANIAAIGMTKDPNRMAQVTAWINWYITHLNWPDKWGMYGTTYNWNVSSNGTETPSYQADSTDSYAATFLSLVWNAWKTGNSNARTLIAGLSYQLDAIGGVLIQTQQSDGLTWAKPDYQIKYLMDNCEAYRGLRDLALLFQNAFGNTAKATYYNNAANKMQSGILGMWLNGKWAVYKDGIGRLAAPNMGVWYADATAQLFPVLMGVVPASDTRAKQSYAAFNTAWPNWPTLSYNTKDAFPWCLVGEGAAAMGDNARLATYINSIQKKYVSSGFPWPFYNAEGGWFLRSNSYMMGRGW
jgi:hypothetical protein